MIKTKDENKKRQSKIGITNNYEWSMLLNYLHLGYISKVDTVDLADFDH